MSNPRERGTPIPEQSTKDTIKRDDWGVDHIAYVEEREFGEYKKTALDLARLLASEELQIKGDAYTAKNTAKIKQKAFDCFCALCVQAGVEPPELEPALFLPFVPEHVSEHLSRETEAKAERLREISTLVFEQAEKVAPALKKRIETIMDFLLLCPDIFDEERGLSGISTPEIIARLNRELLSVDRQKLVRPDYAKMRIETGMQEEPPAKEIRLLIVDDSFEEIIKTFIRCAGWKNVIIEFLHHPNNYATISAEEKQAKISDLAVAITGRKPDVVLMDEGVDYNFDGSEVLRFLKTIPETRTIRFVANTGGNDGTLRQEGAYSNFNKGKNPHGLQQAIRSFSTTE